MTVDTICAPATAPVNSSIAIIRISGPESLGAVRVLFSQKEEIKPRFAHYGTISHNGLFIDDIVLIYYPAPRSYTGEDMVELFCHGNPLIVKKIIQTCRCLGIRYAEPGEFTRRAYLNGKMDLTGAEAINHVIMARSDWEIQAALRQMHGSLHTEIARLRDALITLKADIETGIDFSDDDIEIFSRDNALTLVTSIQRTIMDIKGQCHTGERLAHGIDVTITGKPNAGKSSLLNLLLNQERAIVSEIPGTTRDIIKESIQIEGLLINLIDTAGIDKTNDTLEMIGIQRSEQSIHSSPIIIMIVDAFTDITSADVEILTRLKGKKVVYVINKIDIATTSRIESMVQFLPDPTVLFSAKNGIGLSDLKKLIHEIISREFVDLNHTFIADLRILDLLSESAIISDNVLTILNDKVPDEIVASEIQLLIDTLAEITGDVTPDDILDSIFSRFCIGK